ncbi:cysteine-rich CWC family protein [Kineobactrum salinum]|uniref:Cysteine-rich CWC family protein n=1 Tax=Kineobactrum salinum TaxID=2708301 RepID=A0A6C0U328_9GAMM|nr:cysteine-rich CWC family protein [Kineobactrum salinum]
MLPKKSAKDRCPQCDGPNQCALAEDPAAAGCWCQQACADPALLSAGRTEPGQRRCLCPSCLPVRGGKAVAG